MNQRNSVSIQSGGGFRRVDMAEVVEVKIRELAAKCAAWWLTEGEFRLPRDVHSLFAWRGEDRGFPTTAELRSLEEVLDRKPSAEEAAYFRDELLRHLWQEGETEGADEEEGVDEEEDEDDD